MNDSSPKVTLSLDKKRMLRGSIFLTLSPVAAFFLGLFISILIADLIPPTNYGVFTWFNLLNTFLVTLVPFRLSGAISRFLAVSKGAEKQDEVNALLKTNTVLTLLLVPIGGVLTFILTPLILNAIPGISGLYSILDVTIFALAIMCLLLSDFTVSALKGIQEFNKVGIAQFIANTIGQSAVIFLLIFGVAIQGNVALGVLALIAKWAIVALLTAVMLILSVRQIWTLRGKFAPLKPLVKYAFPVVISFLFAFFFSEFLVRYFLNPFATELGLYGFAVRMVTFINALTIGFYSALVVYYAQAYGKSDAKSLENELRWTLKISLFLFLPLIIGTVGLAPSFFLLLLPDYYWAYQYFVILMGQVFFMLFNKPFSQVLNALARTRTVLIIRIISSIISGFLMFFFFVYGSFFVILGLIDNPLLLIVGGYASSTFFAVLLSAFIIKRYVRISLGIRQVVPLVAIGLVIIPSAVFIHLLYLPPLVEFFSVFIASTLIYLLPIRHFRLISEIEIRKAAQFLPRRMATPFANFVVRLFVRS